MSGTLGTSRNRVRVLIHDTLTGNLVVSEERLTAMIDSACLRTGNILGYSDTWLTAAVTLTAGIVEYSFTAGEYQTLTILRRSDDRVILRKNTTEELESLRAGSTQNAVGRVTDFALYEAVGPLIKVRVYPVPDATAGTLDAFVSSTVSALAADSDVIPFARGGVASIEYLVAAECIASMTPQDQIDRHISAETANFYRAKADEFLDMEKERRTSQRRTDSIRRTYY
jgi:hypothetical protein